MLRFLFALGTAFCVITISEHLSATCGAHALASGQGQAPLKKLPDALNPKLTNIVEKDIITLYYNGSGPVPDYDEVTPLPEPITPLDESLIENAFLGELLSILETTAYPDVCSKCVAAGQLFHFVAISQPVEMVTSLLIRACNMFPFVQDNLRASSCETQFGSPSEFGAFLAQLFSKMSLRTGDFQMLCSANYGLCPEERPIEIDEARYFDPKPEGANIAPEPSGHTIDVLHLSDWHLDPRYDIGSEGNCTQYLCCRPYSSNDELQSDSTNPTLPASRFGSFFCDSPADLALSAFSSMPEFLDMKELAFSIFTGDIVSHDRDDTLSLPYVSYAEELTYRIFKKFLGDRTPVYATLGNHDTLPKDFAPQHSLNPDPTDPSTNALAWNFDLVSSLWYKHNWLNKSEAAFARAHYGAYATTTSQGLRIISLNSDFWYRANVFNYWNVSNPDNTGMLKWLSEELTECEKGGQRAWIIAHALTGYDGIPGLPNPTALFYSIIRRFSPRTIAAVFFGHTHQDQLQIFYDYLPSSLDPITGKRDTLKVDFSRPLTVGHIGPSITPLTGLNAGYRVYQVDSKTFSVIGAQTYFANLSNSLEWTTPVWELEYDTRSAYSNSLAAGVPQSRKDDRSGALLDRRVPWPAGSPLNATFWHHVTESMLADPDSSKSLLELYDRYETKSSSATLHRGSGAIAPEQKVCFLRAGSGALGSWCRELYGGGDARGERERHFGIF
ncbi:uncharacterized protein A1O9_04474 [Exophiala aquamarina CBS 119918]|uniref:Calcineurin-like phosphoesterase domain-containing protein n=1 Tax=Exophiala aquamarina CBS 119918 TaxID=1182545 RepID=A0A072PJX4_9EURO|nr:uncharacterized protein A1O9_04474 [Exophiala aquamarina CBS 119918]KEF59628.1 hypothetical protein A1O9_04474 [Exophiala aquamarina CBS 119918]